MCHSLTHTSQLRGRSSGTPLAQKAALAVLSAWAESSLVNSGKIAMVEGGRVLADIAHAASTAEPPDRAMQANVARCVFFVCVHWCFGVCIGVCVPCKLMLHGVYFVCVYIGVLGCVLVCVLVYMW